MTIKVINDVTIEIIKGETKTPIVNFIKKSGEVVDLTSVTEITVKFSNADGTALSKTKTGGGINITSATGGKFEINLLAAETALLETVSYATMEIELTFPTLTNIVHIPKAYSVIEREF